MRETLSISDTNLENKIIDLCVIDGSPSLDRLNLLTKIAANCCRFTQLNAVKIFSGYPHLAEHKSNFDFQYISVSINSIDEYSSFVIKDLHRYINAEYCLIFQHDGFIINPQSWNKQFLNYDYIGAVFPRAEWNEINRVGNGGFSLRSKKFMDFCSKLNYSGPVNEDKFLCVDHYEDIISQGFSFAPPSLASSFSVEENTEYTDFSVKPFGFHGSSRRPHLYSRTLHHINNLN